MSWDWLINVNPISESLILQLDSILPLEAESESNHAAICSVSSLDTTMTIINSPEFTQQYIQYIVGISGDTLDIVYRTLYSFKEWEINSYNNNIIEMIG